MKLPAHTDRTMRLSQSEFSLLRRIIKDVCLEWEFDSDVWTKREREDMNGIKQALGLLTIKTAPLLRSSKRKQNG